MIEMQDARMVFNRMFVCNRCNAMREETQPVFLKTLFKFVMKRAETVAQCKQAASIQMRMQKKGHGERTVSLAVRVVVVLLSLLLLD